MQREETREAELASAQVYAVSDPPCPDESECALERAVELGVSPTDERVMIVRSQIADYHEVCRAERERQAPFTRLRDQLTSSSSSPPPSAPGSLPFDYLADCTLQWNTDRKLGEGVFGEVFLAVDPARSFHFVVKKINLTSLAVVSENPGELGARMMSNEITALTRFRSPYIVKLVGFTTPSEPRICLAYEYCAGGALSSFLQDDSKAAELTWKHRIRIALGVAKALNYLHRGGGGDRCFHRDVKSANICLTSTLQPKLIDCGLAKFIPEGDARIAVTATNNGVPGTMGYKCPRYEGGDKFSEKSEVFSFGIVLMELIVGDVTIVGKRQKNFYFHFCEDEEEDLVDAFDPRAEGDGEWPETARKGLAALIEGCTKKPAKRMDLQAAMNQLRYLETEHCAETASEKMLGTMRGERDRAVAAGQIQDAARDAAATKECEICMCDGFQGKDGVECEAGHFYCASCYEQTLLPELAAISASTDRLQEHRRRGGKMQCPMASVSSGGRASRCDRELEDRQLAKCLPIGTWSQYEKCRDENYAESIREQAEFDTRAKIRAQFEQGERERRAEEEAAGVDLIEQEIRAGRMMRCVGCRNPIERAGGCDHMHCRGPGGCGAHFDFVTGRRMGT